MYTIIKDNLQDYIHIVSYSGERYRNRLQSKRHEECAIIMATVVFHSKSRYMLFGLLFVASIHTYATQRRERDACKTISQRPERRATLDVPRKANIESLHHRQRLPARKKRPKKPLAASGIESHTERPQLWCER